MHRRMFLLFGAAIVAVSLSSFAGAAVMPADVVNVDFNTSDHGSTTYSGLAAGPVTAGAFWNGIALGAKAISSVPAHNFGPSSALLASDGTTATSITVSLTNISQYMTDENPVAAPVGDLLNDFAYQPLNSNNNALAISGLTAGAKYDLYLYCENGNYNSESATFTLTGGGPSDTVTNSGSSSTFGHNRNYALLSGIIAPGSQTFVINMTSLTNGSLNGFQLVQLVPEPSALLPIGLLAATLFRRRA